jgi:hypothetical protein
VAQPTGPGRLLQVVAERAAFEMAQEHGLDVSDREQRMQPAMPGRILLYAGDDGASLLLVSAPLLASAWWRSLPIHSMAKDAPCGARRAAVGCALGCSRNRARRIWPGPLRGCLPHRPLVPGGAPAAGVQVAVGAV